MPETPQGVKISAYLFFAMAAIDVVAVCALVLISGGLAVNEGEMESIAIFSAVSCLVLLFGLLYGAVGYGLLKVQSWARIGAIGLSILSLCSFPLGTIIGGIVLYFMFQEETTKAFS